MSTERVDRAIYLKSGSYWVVKRNKWTGPHPTLEVARIERDKIEGEQAVKPEGGPFADFMRKYYYPHYLEKMKSNTQFVHKRTYERDIIPFFASKRIADITHLDINEFQEHLRGKGMRATTINGEVILVKMVFKRAKELGFIQKSPAEGIKNLREIKQDRTILTEREIVDLVGRINHPFRYGVALAGLAGARGGEVMGLKWADFELNEKGRINFRRQINSSGEIDELKSKASAATLPIAKDLTKLLLEFKGECPDSEWLFQGKFGDYLLKVRGTKEGPRYKYHSKPRQRTHTFLNAVSISGWWCINRKRYGLPSMRFHDFRHSFATNVVSRCANIKTAQKLCRHNNIETTLEIYAHVHPEQLEEVWDWAF